MSLDTIIGQGGTLIIDPYETNLSPDEFLTKYGNIIDTICLVAKSARGSTYYQSSTAPKDLKFGEVYSSFAQISTDIGLQTYALIHGNMDSFFSRDPNFQMQKSGGNPVASYVCPNQKIYWQYLAEISAEIATKAPIDGIILKDIHYPRETTCFCDNCRMSFSSDFDYNRDFAYDQISKSTKFGKWKEKRQQSISGMIGSIVQRVHKERKIEIYAEVLLDPQTEYFDGADQHFAQNVNALSQVTSNILFHIHPWTKLPNSQDEYNLVMDNLLNKLDIVNSLNNSLFVWGPSGDEFEFMSKMKDALRSNHIFFTEQKPNNYGDRRSLHLDLGV